MVRDDSLLCDSVANQSHGNLGDLLSCRVICPFTLWTSYCSSHQMGRAGDSSDCFGVLSAVSHRCDWSTADTRMPMTWAKMDTHEQVTRVFAHLHTLWPWIQQCENVDSHVWKQSRFFTTTTPFELHAWCQELYTFRIGLGSRIWDLHHHPSGASMAKHCVFRMGKVSNLKKSDHDSTENQQILMQKDSLITCHPF